jgi:hypothetical protein
MELRPCVISERFVLDSNPYRFPIFGVSARTPFLLSTRPYEKQDVLTQAGFGQTEFLNIIDEEGFLKLWELYWAARASEDWCNFWNKPA